MPRTESKNQGAGDTRVQIVRKIRAMMRKKVEVSSASSFRSPDPWINGDDLLLWIGDMDERSAAKPRGLGRK